MAAGLICLMLHFILPRSYASAVLNDSNQALFSNSFSAVFIPDTIQRELADTLRALVSGNSDSLVIAQKARQMLEAKVERSAQDSIVQDLKNRKVYLYGNAIVTYGDIKLEAAYIEFSFETNQVFAKGMPDSTGKMMGLPRFTDKTQTFDSKELHYNFDSKKRTYQ